MAFNNLIDLDRLERFLGKLKDLLDSKVDVETGKGLSTNDYTTAEKNKLSGIEAQANKTVVDSSLSASSTNPVQNQVVKAEADSIRTLANDVVIASDSQPSSTSNKIWLDTDATSVQIPTYAELQALEAVVDGKVDEEAGKGLSTNDYTDAEKTKLAGIAAGAQVNTITGVKGDSENSYRTGNVNITKDNIGLGNVENKSSATIRGELTKSNVTTALGYTPPETNTTYDAMSETEAKTGTATTAKLISAEVLDAAIENKGYLTTHQDISGKLNSSLKGAANGVAELDENGKVPSSQLPSYVDDVVEGYYYEGSFYQNTQHTTGYIPEDGKIYVDLDTNKSYRWSGTAYVVIASDLALGTTSSTAFRGDYGSAAYAHGVTNKGSAFSNGLYKITTNSEGHVTNATSVQKSDITGLGIPGSDTTYSEATTSAAGLMSATDKAKLDGIDTQANKTTVDSALSGTSENPVQNKVVKAAIDAIDEEVILSSTQPSSANNKLWVDDTASGVDVATYAELEALEAVVDTKVDAESGKGLSTNDFTTAEKTKLAGIGEGATKTIIDSALSNSSENPVQNKVVKAALDQLEKEVIVSDTQPTATTNQVWINETVGTGIQMATYAELLALQDELNALKARVTALEQ